MNTRVRRYECGYEEILTRTTSRVLQIDLSKQAKGSDNTDAELSDK